MPCNFSADDGEFIVVIYLIMGALMDEASIQLLTLPIFYLLVARF